MPTATHVCAAGSPRGTTLFLEEGLSTPPEVSPVFPTPGGTFFPLAAGPDGFKGCARRFWPPRFLGFPPGPTRPIAPERFSGSTSESPVTRRLSGPGPPFFWPGSFWGPGPGLMPWPRIPGPGLRTWIRSFPKSKGFYGIPVRIEFQFPEDGKNKIKDDVFSLF